MHAAVRAGMRVYVCVCKCKCKCKCKCENAHACVSARATAICDSGNDLALRDDADLVSAVLGRR